MEKNNLGMVEYAKAQLGRPYWYGTYGQISTPKLYEEKKKQYPKYYTAKDFSKQMGVKVHDCSGLFKGYMMSEAPNAPAKYNAKFDISANDLIKKCKDVDTIDKIPEIPGLVVWKNNHVGCYIGDGYVIEAKGHQYGVVKTKLTATNWAKFGKYPYFDYIGNSYDLFIYRLYKGILNRELDEPGKAYWVSKLESKEMTASEIAKFFLTSEEFTNKNLSDAEFVTILYNVLFDRAPDTDGFNYWMSKFATRTRVGIINGFLITEEWANMCKKFGLSV